MSSKVHQEKFDKRLYERFIRRGELARTDFDKHLADLPDMEAQADSISHLVMQDAGSSEASDA